eukprot:Gregarina_sp_Poly_1__8429@NODE_4966_length_444_cov_9_474801_g3459_i0_p1_GENE_NODE_4966_length_444_cov_9_474801_g3459_i0NODE_4966_length_444_cov_9_474801_g3459_i0_p1_ORF_typecomplete_len109_score2_17Prokineticin/PF06607_11/7_3e12MIT_LIKE_ACTX/PF17556_2/0_12MIT_LIKE_ACTX/PF17556_2/8_6Dickkopf_N/PF04706_12/0_61Dickkopf_N/PF04706_12/1_4e02_NODE_4966_length_444_cov_9_474801_g3459_i051377
MKQYTAALFLALICATTLHIAQGIDAECVDTKDCGVGRCCLLGMQPYSIPSCRDLGSVGSYCFDNKPISTTITYPNGESLTLTDVFLQFPPCAEGLICGTQRTCQEQV